MRWCLEVITRRLDVEIIGTRALSRKLGKRPILAKKEHFFEKKGEIFHHPLFNLFSKYFASKQSFAYFSQKKAASDCETRKRSSLGPGD